MSLGPHSIYLEGLAQLVAASSHEELAASRPAQLEEAFRHFVRAAKLGHIDAQVAYGILQPLRAFPGTDEERSAAEQYLRHCAKRGHLRARDALAAVRSGDLEGLETLLDEFVATTSHDGSTSSPPHATPSRFCLVLAIGLLAAVAFARMAQLSVAIDVYMGTACALLIAAFAFRDTAGNCPPHCRLAPAASPSIPILGSAPFYRRDPVAFLLGQNRRLGSIFGLNLAGFNTVIVCDPVALRQFATAPESELSAIAAVADFGFEDTLGSLNVFVGAAVHKFVLKNHLLPMLDGMAGKGDEIATSVQRAVGRRIVGSKATIDVIPCMRRIFLDVSLDLFVGVGVLEDQQKFVEDYMVFQDTLEGAIAKAVVLPSWLSRLLLTRRVGRARQRLEAVLEADVRRLWQTGGHGGVWVKNLRSVPKSDLFGGLRESSLSDNVGGDFLPASGPDRALQDGDETLSSHDVATLIIGLLFAAHKVVYCNCGCSGLSPKIVDRTPESQAPKQCCFCSKTQMPLK